MRIGYACVSMVHIPAGAEVENRGVQQFLRLF
jgi:hypothetical protein